MQKEESDKCPRGKPATTTTINTQILLHSQNHFSHNLLSYQTNPKNNNDSDSDNAQDIYRLQQDDELGSTTLQRNREHYGRGIKHLYLPNQTKNKTQSCLGTQLGLHFMLLTPSPSVITAADCWYRGRWVHFVVVQEN